MGEISTMTPASTPNEAPARSRRSLLVGLAGGMAAWAATAAGRAAPVDAANGDVVHVGDSSHTGTATTGITSTTQNISVIWGSATPTAGTGVGVRGDSGSPDGSGVWGNGSGTGVKGTSSEGTGVLGSNGSSVAPFIAAGVVGSSDSATGVAGFSKTSDAVAGYSNAGTGVSGVSYAEFGLGVLGFADIGTGVKGLSTTKRGVHGESNSGYGVYGRSDTAHGVHGVGPAASAIGVYGESSHGVALYGRTVDGYSLQTDGRLRFDHVSGVAAIAPGKKSVTVSPGVGVTGSSLVLLTPRTNIGSRGLWFTLNTTANTFTIRISSTRTKSTPVAWLLLG